MKLCTDRRGVNSKLSYLGPKRVELIYEMPLAEVIYDFYDRFKSLTQGYGSFDYDLLDYRESELVLLDILVNGEIRWMPFPRSSTGIMPGRGPCRPARG
jgi:GTP-binding protein LepA